jgi:hypothetical protein
VVAVGPEAQADGHARHDVVEPVAEDLAALRGQHGVQEDAAEGDLAAALVAEGVVDDDPDGAEGDEVAQDEKAEDGAELVPVPPGVSEEVIDGGPVAARAERAGLPALGQGARAGADQPGDRDLLEVVEGLGAEAGAGVG